MARQIEDKNLFLRSAGEENSRLQGALSREQSQAKEYQEEYHDALSRMQEQATEYQQRFKEEQKKTASLESVVQSLQTDLLSVRNMMNEMTAVYASTRTEDKEELTEALTKKEGDLVEARKDIQKWMQK